jgi:2,3-bisphosphoglycerate-dependent phosphoglycerate mutase
MTTAATVLLVRHGETAWNRERRVQGWAPTGLTDRGKKQAHAAGGAIGDAFAVDRVVASDLRRTAETARLLRRAGEIDAGVEFDPAWRERDFGRLQGLGYEELFEGFPEFALGEVGVEAARAVPEGGESLLGMRERVLGAWERLLEGEGTVVVVTHGGPIYVLLGHLKGIDLVDAVLGTDYRNGAITELRREGDDVEIRRENHVPTVS